MGGDERRRRWALVALLGLLATALRSIGLAAPWGADNFGTAGAFFSIAARNYFRYGYVATHGVPVVTAEGPPSPAVYYTHHPPLFELLVSASFRLFGEHEWAARLVPLVFSLVALGLLVHLAARAFGWRVALLTLAIAATLPLDAHLAAHVDVQGSVLLALVLATLACVMHRRYGAAIACFTLAAAVDWPALYLPVLLALAPWPFDFPRPRRFVAGLLAYGAVLFVALSAWTSDLGSIVALLHGRALSFASDTGVPFDLGGWFRVVVGTYLWELCTPLALVAVVVWCVWRVPTLVRTPHPERLALLLLLFGLAHLIVGFQGAYQHEFWTTYLRAAVPLVCALLLDRVAGHAPGGWRRTVVVAGLALTIVPGLAGTLRLAVSPLSARPLGGYAPRDLADAIRSCTPAGAGALTSDYSGESAIFYYANRPLGIGIVDVDALEERLVERRYDPPGGSADPYLVPTARPACFVLPLLHVRYFPALTAHLRSRYQGRRAGAFEIFSLRAPGSLEAGGSRPSAG